MKESGRSTGRRRVPIDNIRFAEELGGLQRVDIGAMAGPFPAHYFRMTNHRPVRDYMTPLPHTIGVEHSVEAASRRMRQLGVRHLPVIKEGTLCGVVSERDILFLQSTTGIDPELTRVEAAMSPEPFVVGPDMPVGFVAREMAQRRVGSAVVVDDESIVGILTTTDAMALLGELADFAVSTPPPQLLPSAVKERVLEEHNVLRELLATASAQAARVLDAGDQSDEQLSLRARELYGALTRHLDLEDVILAPALRQADAWGPVRAKALAEEHHNQRKQLQHAFGVLASGSGAINLARVIQSLVPSVLEDMEREERELLAVLTDSLARVDSGG